MSFMDEKSIAIPYNTFGGLSERADDLEVLWIHMKSMAKTEKDLEFIGELHQRGKVLFSLSLIPIIPN